MTTAMSATQAPASARRWLSERTIADHCGETPAALARHTIASTSASVQGTTVSAADTGHLPADVVKDATFVGTRAWSPPV